MTFRIHFEHADGSTDHIDLHGNSIDEIRAQLDAALNSRGIDLATAWSDEIPS